MTVKNAKLFISRIQEDKDLRERLNSAPSSEEVNAILEKEGFMFGNGDFIEAHSFLLANSASPDDEEDLRLLKLWWDFLMGQD